MAILWISAVLTWKYLWGNDQITWIIKWWVWLLQAMACASGEWFLVFPTSEGVLGNCRNPLSLRAAALQIVRVMRNVDPCRPVLLSSLSFFKMGVDDVVCELFSNMSFEVCAWSPFHFVLIKVFSAPVLSMMNNLFWYTDQHWDIWWA